MINLLLKPIDTTTLLWVVGLVALLTVVFAALIVLVSKVCAVKTDEKAEAIQEHLAGANCGGCGYAGCADFAKAVSEGKADFKECGPTSPEGKAAIAEILGVPFSATEETFAVIACSGGNNAKDKFSYVGNEGCLAQVAYVGGRKACADGCMGGGTCISLCPYHAIALKNGVAYADRAICESCGLCVRECPKNLIHLIPKSAKVYVACSSHCKGKTVMDACKAGCIGCGMCAKNCPNGAITMVDNVAIIDYSKCDGCKTCIAKCPRKCIKEI